MDAPYVWQTTAIESDNCHKKNKINSRYDPTLLLDDCGMDECGWKVYGIQPAQDSTRRGRFWMSGDSNNATFMIYHGKLTTDQQNIFQSVVLSTESKSRVAHEDPKTFLK